MNKITLRKIIFYTLFTLSTLITIVILYTNMTSIIAYAYVVTYALFLLVLLAYFIIVTIIQLTRLERHELVRRIRAFIMYFVLLTSVNLALHYISPLLIGSITNAFFIAGGLALGITFADLLFKKI